MLTNITLTVTPQPNRVLLSRAGLVRVASVASGTIGTVKAEGVTVGTAVSWSLQGNPGSSISISSQADTTLADISFANIPTRPEPYLLIIQATTPDGVSQQIPLAVVVREAFSLEEVGHTGAAGFTVTGNTFDAGIAPLVIKGQGPTGVVGGVKYITPTDMPAGLEFHHHL